MTAAAEVVVRPVDEDQWELWRDLRHQALGTDPDAFGSTLEREQSYTEAEWRRRVGGGRSSVVAWLGERPVGMGGLFEEGPGSCWVVAMWVEPAARGRGIGRLVLEHLLAAVHADVDVHLWVADGNPARELYAKAGFVDTGEVAPLRPGSSISKSRMTLIGSRTRKVLPTPTSESTRMLP